MGAYQSRLTSEEVAELEQSTHLNGKDIELLYRRFKRLDRKRVGYITSQEFQLIPELFMNPLCQRLTTLFDPTGTDQVTFDRFVKTISGLSANATREERVAMVFRCYDVDNDGVISEQDLLHVLKCMVGSNMSDEALSAIAMRLILESPKNANGQITIDECSQVLGDLSDFRVDLSTWNDDDE